MSGSLQFEYKSLKDRQIRLLSWNTHHTQPRLIHVSIDQPPKYDALSYCWGVENCLHPFQLQCGETAITSSLRTALSQYRETPYTGMLWVDALCINQNDAAEKTQQIKLMAEVYSRAETVLVSLGDLTSDARCAVVLIPYVMQKLMSTSEIGSMDIKRSSQWYNIDPFPLFWSGIAQINHHPWFRRVWTLQEAVLAHRLRFIGDGIFIGFEALLSLFDCLHKKNFMGKLGYGPFRGPTAMTSMLQIDQYRYRFHQGLPAYDLILTIEQRESSYMKDYVYGLLGILGKSVVQKITTSEVRVSSLYVQATLSIIEAESSVNILKLAYNEGNLDIPSWCVNFADKDRPVDFNRGSFSAGLGSTDRFRQVETCFTLDSDVLVVSGKVLDKIVAVVRPYETEACTSHDAFLLWNFACCQATLDRHQKSSDFLPLLAETVCGGYLPGPNRLYRPSDIQAYHAMTSAASRSQDERTRLYDQYKDYVAIVYLQTKNRTFFVTQNGRVGLGPPRTFIGDVVSIIATAEVPFVLRQTTDNQPSYQLIGQAYVPGIMHGEAVADQSIDFEEIRLI